MKRGYIKLWRKVQDSQSWSRSALHRALFVTLLVQANWGPSWFRGVEVPAGAAAVTVRGLADELGTPSSSVFKALKDLEKDAVLSLCSVDRKWTLIKLNNWATYQNLESVQINTDCTLNEHSKEYKNIRNNNARDKSLVSSAEPETPAPSDENAEKEAPVKQPPLCPQTRILALYHEILFELPHMKIWEGDAKREGNLRARWRDCWKRGKYTTIQEGLDYWRTVFEYIRDKCPFLMGQVLDHEGNPRFRATLEWIVKSGNFAKIIEHKYEREVAA